MKSLRIPLWRLFFAIVFAAVVTGVIYFCAEKVIPAFADAGFTRDGETAHGR